jgi:hypothetical protein
MTRHLASSDTVSASHNATIRSANLIGSTTMCRCPPGITSAAG